MLGWRRLGLGGVGLGIALTGACASSEDVAADEATDDGGGGGGATAGGGNNAGSGNTGNAGAGNAGTGNTGNTGGVGGTPGTAGSGGNTGGSAGTAGDGAGGTGAGGTGGTGATDNIEQCDGLTVTWTDPGDGTLTYTYTGDIALNTDDEDACAAATVAGLGDVVFAIPFDVDARLDVEVAPFFWTAAVQLTDTCLDGGVCEAPVTLPFPVPSDPVLVSATGKMGEVMFLGVDALDAGLFGGAFTVTMTLTAAEESCPGLPVTLADPDLTFEHTGDTTTRGHDLATECADTKGATTNDVVYEVNVSGPGTVQMSVTPDGWDAALEIRNGATCETLSALACVDAPATAGPESHRFRKETTGDETYWAVIEGTFETATAKAGPYTFNASFTPEPDKEKCGGQEVTWSAATGTVTYSDAGDLNSHYADLGRCRTKDDASDVVYWLDTPDAAGTLELTVTGKNNTWKPSVGIHAACDAWNVADCIQPDDYVMKDVRRQAGTQTLFVTIEGDAPNAAGTPATQEYVFDARFVPEPAEEVCPGLDVTWEDVDTLEHPAAKTFTIDGDTRDNWDDYDGGCAKIGAKDVVYRVPVPEAGKLTLTVDGDVADLVLYVAEGSCDDATVICANTGGIEGWPEEVVVDAAVQDAVYFVFIDGGEAVATGDDAGTFKLTGFLDP